MQDLIRQIKRKLDKVEDQVVLNSILEILNDHDNEEDEVASAEASDSIEREGNRKLPPPTKRRYESDADSWLDTLGR